MRQFDPTLELVACGSSNRQMPTFGAWEATVLDHAYDDVDFISAHAYYQDRGDTGSFLASSVNMDDFINDVVATADFVRAKKSRTKRINISFDEWNVWYVDRVPDQLPETWAPHPRISEEAYTVTDAVVAGSLMITLLRHSDRVTSACVAQLVNTISMIRAEPDGPAWRQSIFHPFSLSARHAKGEVLDIQVLSPTYETASYGDVPLVDATATHDPATGDTVLFAVNRHQGESIALEVDLTALPGADFAEGWTLTDEDPLAANTAEQPDRVAPRDVSGSVTEGVLRVELPAVSWSCLRLSSTPVAG